LTLALDLDGGPHPVSIPGRTSTPDPHPPEVLRGAALREYLERSAAQRATSAPNRHRKKNKWRERKWGAGKPPAADGGEGSGEAGGEAGDEAAGVAGGEAAGEAGLPGSAAAVGAKRSRDETSGAEDAGGGTGSKHTRSE
jgi:hypothetical protein